MGQTSEVKVPDIGNYTNVPVIEVLVKAGDTVTKDQGLVTLESDKATMEVPAPFDGVVKEIKVKVGDEISEGAIVALIEAAGAKSKLQRSLRPPQHPRRNLKLQNPRNRALRSPRRSRRRRRNRRLSVRRRSRSAPTPYCRTRSPTPARRYACSRANLASTSAGSAPAADARAALPRKTCRISSRLRSPAALQRAAAVAARD